MFYKEQEAISEMGPKITLTYHKENIVSYIVNILMAFVNKNILKLLSSYYLQIL